MKTKGNQYFENCNIHFFLYLLDGGLNLGNILNNSYMHNQIYPKCLEELRETLINFMAKPKEVLVVIDENGEAVEEHFDDTETISIYE